METEKKKIVCPNCGVMAIKEGTKIVCESCDATFSFTRDGAAKVDNVGRLESVESRLDRVESLLPGGEPDPADPADPADPPDPADPRRSPDPADPAKAYDPNADSLLGPE